MKVKRIMLSVYLYFERHFFIVYLEYSLSNNERHIFGIPRSAINQRILSRINVAPNICLFQGVR